MARVKKVAKRKSVNEKHIEILKTVFEKEGYYVGGWGLAERIIRKFKRAIQPKAARAKDRKYTSNEKHEVAYSKKRKSPVIKYKTKTKS